MSVMNVVEMVMIAAAMLVPGWALGRGRGAPADPRSRRRTRAASRCPTR